jgi:hypothetical protein
MSAQYRESQLPTGLCSVSRFFGSPCHLARSHGSRDLHLSTLDASDIGGRSNDPSPCPWARRAGALRHRGIRRRFARIAVRWLHAVAPAATTVPGLPVCGTRIRDDHACGSEGGNNATSTGPNENGMTVDGQRDSLLDTGRGPDLDRFRSCVTPQCRRGLKSALTSFVVSTTAGGAKRIRARRCLVHRDGQAPGVDRWIR